MFDHDESTHYECDTIGVRSAAANQLTTQDVRSGALNKPMGSFSTFRLPPLSVAQPEAEALPVSTVKPQQPIEGRDEILLITIARGEQESLAQLFRIYARSVLSIGQRILRDQTEAEDLVQEVFLYIHRKSALFDRSKGSGRSWIYQVAYTQALIRRRQLKFQEVRASALDRPGKLEIVGTSGADYDRSMEVVFGRERWKCVWGALSECQRETLRLHFYEGFTFAEIGEKLGQSYVNVRHHYYRALKKLRNHASEHELRWP
jgi:RNA polymerase sigma-70 factor, ECF subfamily